MLKERRDSQGRLLWNNEYQRRDGRYVYRYRDQSCQMRYLYSWRLTDTDEIPAGEREVKSLREKETEAHYEVLWSSRGLKLGDRITVMDMVDRYISIRTNVKYSTTLGYKTVQSVIKREEFGTRMIDCVTMADAKIWLMALQTKGKSFSSIHTIRGVVRQAFQMAVEDGLLERNPFDFQLSGILINDSKRRESLTVMEEKEVLKFVKNDKYFCKYYDMIFLLLNTGLRISEMCGLTVRDVDFERGCIAINRTFNRYGKRYVTESTMTRSGTRMIPMSDNVRASMKSIIDKRKEQEQTVKVEELEDLLFLDRRGVPLLPNMVEKYFQRICEKFSMENNYDIYITPHICRHTFCTKMVREGMKPKVLQYLMGHSRIDTTLEYYAHIDYDQVSVEVDRIMNR